MLLKIRHRTVYHYKAFASESHNEARLEPISDGSQTCLQFNLWTEPESKVFSFTELGGEVHFFDLRTSHRSLTVYADSIVETYNTNPFDGLNLIVPDLSFYEKDPGRQRWAEYLSPSRYVPLVPGARELAEASLTKAEGVTSQFLLALNRSIYENFTYDPDVTHVHSTVQEVLDLRAGVCQDFAHVMIACCRSVGVPARYVSGYLYNSHGSGIRGADAMHAWVECPLPDGRWLAIDPTNNLLANDHHIRVHTGRDYDDIVPLRGLYKGRGLERLEVEVVVGEVPRFEQVSA